MSGHAGEVKVGVATKFTFAVKDEFGSLKSGLLNAAFTKTLRDDSGASAVTVTVSERGSTGVYDAALTPDVVGEAWYLLVEHSSYGKWDGVFRVTARAKDDLAYPATSGRSLAVSAAGAVDALLAAGAITTATFGAGAINAAAIGADAITAAKIATGAIDADALATDAVTEIQAAVAAGSVASVVGAVGSVTGAVGSVTGAVGSVAGNVGGNVVGTVASVVGAVGSVTAAVTTGAISANAVNASALAADAVAEIAAAISSPSAATIAAAVADEALSGHTTAGSLGEALLRLRSTILGSGTLQSELVLSASASSDSQAYRGALLIPTGGTGAGQGGKLIATYNGTTKAYTTYANFGTALDGTTTYVILAVSDYSRYVGDLLGSVTSLGAGAITASSISSGAITAAKFAAGAITATVIATDAIDADALAADAVTEIQSGLATASALAVVAAYVDELETRLTSGRAAALDFLDVAVSSRLATAGYTAAPTAAQNALELLDTQQVKSRTLRDTLARIAATSHGKISGMAAGTPSFRHQDDSADAVTAVVDADGNRTSVTLP